MEVYTVRHNIEECKFEVEFNEKIAILSYIQDVGDSLNIMHTLVPQQLQGRGIAGKLTEAILEYAQEHHLKVRPICSYAVDYIARHAEYGHLIST